MVTILNMKVTDIFIFNHLYQNKFIFKKYLSNRVFDKYKIFLHNIFVFDTMKFCILWNERFVEKGIYMHCIWETVVLSANIGEIIVEIFGCFIDKKNDLD